MSTRRMNLLKKIADHQTLESGFTIVELMIAMSVLSVILLLSSTTLIRLGSLYSKGTNQVNTQNVARNVLNALASQIQFGADGPADVGPGTPALPGAVCIGNQRYSFILGHELATIPSSNDPAPVVLWNDTIKSGVPCVGIPTLASSGSDPTDIYTDTTSPGTELIPEGMRLTDFSVATTSSPAIPGLYQLTVTVAYGDDDLVDYDSTSDTTTCRGGTGSEFCAVSSLSETVTQRLAE
jgi:prepilin-type N-terminal cleavage/methylation domain-containing protein